jgi:ribosomal protein S18 acetylase RimI-like enzyme
VAQQGTDVFAKLERFCDALPRLDGRVEDFGGLVLFVREDSGWPFYARPRPGAETPSAADVTAVRQRQRALGLPEAFEWIHENTPDLLAAARSGGLDVLLAPLMVLEPAALVPDLPVSGASIHVLDPADLDFPRRLAAARAVTQLGFGTPATDALTVGGHAGGLAVEPAGPAQRDAVPPPADDVVAQARHKHAGGDMVTAVVDAAADGIVATGIAQRVRGVAEIAGVTTLPSHRRRGSASQLTATLARHARENGADIVFLAATDDDTARLYSRVGFRRIGTSCIAKPAAVPL